MSKHLVASGAFARAWLNEFAQRFEAHKTQLGELDRQAGDGDFAVNISLALARVDANLARLDGATATASDVFTAASDGFLHTGGTSGPLLGIWLRGLAKALAADADPLTALASGVAAGTATVQRLGGAQTGDKTMVDAMLPAQASLEQAQANGQDVLTALREAGVAAVSGAQATTRMRAVLGRASYVGDAAEGLMDPGARAVALFFEAAAPAWEQTAA